MDKWRLVWSPFSIYMDIWIRVLGTTAF